MNTKLVPLKCSICGANLPRETLICGYCGAHFVLSEDEFAVQAELRSALEQTAEVCAERVRVTKEDIEDAEEDFYSEDGFISYHDVKKGDFDLDDRVDRKILRYVNETGRGHVDAINKKYYEYTLERDKLRKRLKSGEIDEDTFEDLLEEARQSSRRAEEQIGRLISAKNALSLVQSFIYESIGSRSNDFSDIKYVNRIVFNSIDAKASGDSFIYKITGYIDCTLKSGMFLTKQGRKYFSAEVNYKTGKLFPFRWEPDDLLNVEEYRARPLLLPKFI